MKKELTTPKHIYYVFSGRFPSEKAHALYTAYVCDSFARLNYSVTLVVPRRFGRSLQSYDTFFSIEPRFKVVYVPTVDIYFTGLTSIAFYVQYFSFTFFSVVYTLIRAPKRAIVFSNESVPSLLLALCGRRVVYEMHDYPGKAKLFFKLLMQKVYAVVTQNVWKRDRLVSEFNVAETKVIVEHNAIDPTLFISHANRGDVRTKLQLQQEAFVVLYTGQLLPWKGVDTLARAFVSLPENCIGVFIGGSFEQIESFSRRHALNTRIRVLGYKPHKEIPLWLSAADCLVLPNTAKEAISSTYTSPMKLFEYMASGVPIVASDIPSVRSVVSEREVLFTPPDDPEELRAKILYVYEHCAESTEKAKNAQQTVSFYTWEKRAVRIVQALTRIDSNL